MVDHKVSIDTTQGDIKPKSEYSEGLQIHIPLISSIKSLKIEVKGFDAPNVIWLTYIMKQYENKLWMKLKTEQRLTFKCLFCSKVLFRFCSLKHHLFNHLEIFPFKCHACTKTYTSNQTLTKHKRAKHLEELLNPVT